MKNKKKSFQYYFGLIFTKKEYPKIFLLFLGSVLLAFFEILGVASIAPFMSMVMNQNIILENNYLKYIYDYFNYASETDFIIHAGIIVVVLLGISNLFSTIMFYFMTYFSKFHGHRLSMRILRNYLHQEYAFFLNINSAELGKNILSEVDRIVKGVVLAGIQAASKLVLAVSVILFLFIFNPTIGLFLLITIGGSYLLIFVITRNLLNSIGIKSTFAVTERFKTVNESFTGIKDVKLKNLEYSFINRFRKPSIDHAKYTSLALVISAIPRYLIEFIAFAGVIGIVIYLLNINLPSDNIISSLAVFAVAGYRLMPALQNIYAGISMIKFNQAALDVLVKGLNLQFNRLDKMETTENNLSFKKNISLEKISFSYPLSDQKVLNNLSVEIKKYETVGLIGQTGSGKTTLVDLLLGLLTPCEGKIYVDGTALNKENLTSFKEFIGYVPQFIYLIDDTIAANIAFGNETDHINEAKLNEAVEMSNLSNFVNELPDGLSTIVGENGVRLSGGQRQRIGIARALYQKPELLVLDEATSSLDGNTEDSVMTAINNLQSNVTIIIIAHRLETLKKCNKIFMLENGSLKNTGTYNTLMQSEEISKIIPN